METAQVVSKETVKSLQLHCFCVGEVNQNSEEIRFDRWNVLVKHLDLPPLT